MCGSRGTAPLLPKHLVFSFKYYDCTNPNFGPSHAKDGYLKSLLERFRDLCQLPLAEFMQYHKAVRSHSIVFAETSEPDGFAHIRNTALWENTARQFEVSKSQHGRVHGFMIDPVFFVVWIDPDHKLYS